LSKANVTNFIVGDFEMTCQRCHVNLIRIHLLLGWDVEHNSNMSGPIILLKIMKSGVWTAGDI